MYTDEKTGFREILLSRLRLMNTVHLTFVIYNVLKLKFDIFYLFLKIFR